VVEDLRNFVGGQETDFDYDKRLDLINPSTGEVFATAPISSEAEVTAAWRCCGSRTPSRRTPSSWSRPSA
jgi:betaine-aldehyde dehydrogenase